MIINNFIRYLIGCLSAWYPNKKISYEKDSIIRGEILKKIKDINVNKKNLKKTHIVFNQKITYLLKNSNLKNFLREGFIQKMFFLHNRLFVLHELIEIKNSRKWKRYQKLLLEDHIGNPIRYFLYLKSSGNRINHIYQLKILENEFKVNLKKDIKSIFEFGAGYGLMARIFSIINHKIKYVCFDTKHLNLLQYYFLKHNDLDVGFSKDKKIYLSSNFKNININSDLFIANWSLSETSIDYRKKFISKIFKSKYIFISFQERFENINNLKYFSSLKTQLSKKFDIKIIKNRFYKGNFFFNQNHYFFLGRRL